jgi:hypothetical protein
MRINGILKAFEKNVDNRVEHVIGDCRKRKKKEERKGNGGEKRRGIEKDERVSE